MTLRTSPRTALPVWSDQRNVAIDRAWRRAVAQRNSHHGEVQLRVGVEEVARRERPLVLRPRLTDVVVLVVELDRQCLGVLGCWAHVVVCHQQPVGDQRPGADRLHRLALPGHDHSADGLGRLQSAVKKAQPNGVVRFHQTFELQPPTLQPLPALLQITLLVGEPELPMGHRLADRLPLLTAVSPALLDGSQPCSATGRIDHHPLLPAPRRCW